ncbi:hypothetical protein B0O99DRAFT_612792, partial [Bisporella sp. PMI_857]
MITNRPRELRYLIKRIQCIFLGIYIIIVPRYSKSILRIAKVIFVIFSPFTSGSIWCSLGQLSSSS